MIPLLKSSNTQIKWTETIGLKESNALIDKNKEAYSDFLLTPLQFTLTNVTRSSRIDLSYANRLTDKQAEYATFVKWSAASKTWIAVATTYQRKEKEIQCLVEENGEYAVAVNGFWYSKITQRLAEEFPQWTDIRKEKLSLGQQFLNAFGLEIEEVESYLQWMTDQKFINTLDVTMHDWIYAYDLPPITSADIASLTAVQSNKKIEVPILEDLRSFFYNPSGQGGIIDYQEKSFYSTVSYRDLELKLIKVLDPNEPTQQATTHRLEPRDYHVWNTLDEFGLLVGVTRLFKEKNEELKQRILDVFRFPANSSLQGMIHGLGRELQLMRSFTWRDDSKPCVIQSKSGQPIHKETILIDNEPVDQDLVQGFDYIVKIEPLNQRRSHEVRFVIGVRAYELHDQSDTVNQRKLFRPNGQATSQMMKWVNQINTTAPVLWDSMRWNVGFWDTINKNLVGATTLPNQWDTEIDKWINKRFNPQRWERVTSGE